LVNTQLENNTNFNKIYSCGAGANILFDAYSIMSMQGLSRSDDLFTSTNRSNVHMIHVLENLGFQRSGVIHNLDPDDPEIVYVKQSVQAQQGFTSNTLR